MVPENRDNALPVLDSIVEEYDNRVLLVFSRLVSSGILTIIAAFCQGCQPMALSLSCIVDVRRAPCGTSVDACSAAQQTICYHDA